MTLSSAALFQFNVWSVMVPLAIVGGYAFAVRRARQAGLPTNEFESAVTWALVVGFVVSHAVEILLYHPQKLQKEGFFTLFKFWEGLSSYGGIAGSLATFAVFYRLRRKRWWREADVIVQGFIAGWIFGRLGCTIAGDHPGPRTSFFMAYPYPDGARHNLGLYEFLFTLLILFPANLLLHRAKPPVGSFLALNFLLYGAGRFALDFLRATDVPNADPRYGSLTLAHYCSIATFLFGVWAFVQARRRRFEAAPPP